MDDRSLLANLILLDMNDFDVIQSMDWLSAYHASINCFRNTVMFTLVYQLPFVFQGIKESRGLTIISAIKARKLMKKGCIGNLASLPHINDLFKGSQYFSKKELSPDTTN